DGLQALENLGTVNIESNPEEPEEVSTDEMPVVEPRAEPEEAPVKKGFFNSLFGPSE
ncbi:MAG: hypothetical protein ACI9QC_000052, partial [Oceanicoccus sp.]